MDIEQREWVGRVTLLAAITIAIILYVWLFPIGIILCTLAVILGIVICETFQTWIETGIGPIGQLQREFGDWLRIFRMPK